METVKSKDTPGALKSFIAGKRDDTTEWCDWNIPLQWGALSDPFQPVELVRKTSLTCLKIFADSQYPVLIGTKGTGIITRPEYLDLVRASNAVVKVSMLSPKYDKIEPGAPPYAERLLALPALSKAAKRLIVRFQPWTIAVAHDCLNSLPALAAAGVYGVIFEGMKLNVRRQGFIRGTGDMVYPKAVLKPHAERLRDAVHAAGMKFLAGENRLRGMGDSLTCCGCEGLDGFTPNKANLNHKWVGGETVAYTPAMQKKGSSLCFMGGHFQETSERRVLEKLSFADLMEVSATDKAQWDIFYGK